MNKDIRNIPEDQPVRLRRIADEYFGGSITASGLKIEGNRGNLEMFMIAGKFYTTLKADREMMERCRVNANHHASNSGNTRTGQDAGASVMAKRKLERDALNRMLNGQMDD